jgi:hypothetical protein
VRTGDVSKPDRRRRHAWLYALPHARLPAHIEYGPQRFEHVTTFKHDFFAATGLYRGNGQLAILKMGRANDLLGVPMQWNGVLLTRREVRFYDLLRDVPGVPRLIGTVGETGFLREFVPGRPLVDAVRVPDAFFDQLQETIAALHAQHVAYVDLDKQENILVGEDGKPYLIDFQIALHLPPTGWRRLWPVRWLLTQFQRADRYHYLKHKRRLRPDLLTDSQWAEVERVSWAIRAHRWLTRPFTNLRRLVLRALSRSRAGDVAGSSRK